MSDAGAIAILLPLVGALLCSVLPWRGGRLVAGGASAGTLLAAALVARSVAAGQQVVHQVGGWAPPLGIELRADGLAAVMLLAVSVVGVLVTASALRQEATGAARGRFVLRFLFAWAALDAVVLSADLFNLYVALELTTLSTVAFLALGETAEASGAALRYLLVALLGSLAYLLGVALLYGLHATLELHALAARLTPGLATWTALSLLVVGLCLKTALFPLHAWLPPIYAGAQPPVAALLSGLLGKAPLYVLLRLWLELFPAQLERSAGPLLGALGAVGVLWGSLLALRQLRLGSLVAYASVAQVGNLFLLFPLGTAAAFAGGVYLAVAHAAAQAALFLAAGTLRESRGHDEIARLAGLAGERPVSCFAFAIAGVSLMGIPPSGGFVGKWLMLRVAIEHGHWWVAVVLVAGGLLAAGYLFRILRQLLLQPPAGPPPRRMRRGAELPALALALISLLLGLAPSWPLQLLAVGLPP